MSLTEGVRIGPYQIRHLIGAGGMGEVYRALDTTLNRDVAIKVLPDAFAQDSDRLARFTREAQTLALLNHPNIAHIHGLEESAGLRALVMELVEGDDLASQVARGPLPARDAIAIARQIAEALEAAHELGIVHRDLKPANIKVRADGTVKVLDFGLAKASGPDAVSGPAAMLANSPTITSVGWGGTHTILGTAAYMSPEQAAGKPVDKRTDLWALGVVLFEMLSGRRAFDGPDAPHVIASVLKSEPDWAALPADTPMPVRRLLKRCLVKDRKHRLDSAAGVRFELDDATAPHVVEAALSAGVAAAPVPRRWMIAAPWVAVAVVGAALAWTLLNPSPKESSPVVPRKLLVSLGTDASVLGTGGRGSSAVLSPDGTMMAFAAQPFGQNETHLFVRRLDQLQATLIADSDGTTNVFFSPDGKSIGFFASQRLKKVPVEGGAPVTLCDTPYDRGGTWTADDRIIYASGMQGHLFQVPAAGGAASPFGPSVDAAEKWPQALPDGKSVIFTRHSGPSSADESDLVIAPLSGGAGKVVLHGGYFGRYVASDGDRAPKSTMGHLLYIQGDGLFAIRFDLARLETVGAAAPALQGVASNSTNGGAHFSVSSDGTLMYLPGANITNASEVHWMTRDGKVSALRGTMADWDNPAFSPDGKKLAIDIRDGKNRDVWVYDWTLDTLTRVTFDAALDFAPVWTPDGKRIVFASDRARPGVTNLYWVNADGTGQVTRLTDGPNSQQAYSWHPTGKFLSFHESRGAATRFDLMILPMLGDGSRGWTPGAPEVFLSTPAMEEGPVFSPDGKWIAYMSDESRAGMMDTYVRPFPAADAKWRVTTGGGGFARWVPETAHELVFWGNPLLMAVPFNADGGEFRAGKPYAWSPIGVVRAGLPFESGLFAFHPDGQRLAFSARPDPDSAVRDKVVFVSRFFDYLHAIAPGR